MVVLHHFGIRRPDPNPQIAQYIPVVRISHLPWTRIKPLICGWALAGEEAIGLIFQSSIKKE